MNDIEKAIEFATRRKTNFADFGGGEVSLGLEQELNEAEHAELQEHLRTFMPWRKGPFRLFGHEVKANWKSDLKWKRVLSYIDDLQDKTVCDVGCNNGYFLYRMAARSPASVLGLDPVQRFYDVFRFLNTFYPLENVEYKQEGYEYLENYKEHFDLVFCMGVIYHHRDPVGILRTIHRALKTGGQLVLESLGIPDDLEKTNALDGYSREELNQRENLSSYSLVPAKKYAGATGVWNVPTAGCLINWLTRSGFRDIKVQDMHTYLEEQERTDYAPIPGLIDFLDPNDNLRTIEGYPAPIRIHITARR